MGLAYPAVAEPNEMQAGWQPARSMRLDAHLRGQMQRLPGRDDMHFSIEGR